MTFRQSKEFRESLKRESIKIPDKQVNYFIFQLQPSVNRNEDYQKYLALWNQYMAIRKKQLQQANKILSLNSRTGPHHHGGNLCQICYEQMTRKRSWCRICGSECCQKCCARLRIVANQTQPVLFCEKCDRQYMIAMVTKEQQDQFNLRQKAFQKLAEEQDMIESLLKIEKIKMNGSQETKQKNQLLIKMNMITQISANNQSLKHEISQIKKKVQWGQQIKAQLKRKLKKLRKDQSHSFTSSMHEDHDGWAPPKADQQDYVSVQNLNQSIINSILQNQTEDNVKNGLKCNCSLF